MSFYKLLLPIIEPFFSHLILHYDLLVLKVPMSITRSIYVIMKAFLKI